MWSEYVTRVIRGPSFAVLVLISIDADLRNRTPVGKKLQELSDLDPRQCRIAQITISRNYLPIF